MHGKRNEHPARRFRVVRGDFQTPPSLADAVCRHLRRRGLAPASVLEPACGTGAFLVSALRAFPSAGTVVGLDIDPDHVKRARGAVETEKASRVTVLEADFFTFDWPRLLDSLAPPVLVLGNPPWVTTSALGTLRTGNRPPRRNRGRQRGIDAITGPGTFDISLFMIQRALEWVAERSGALAMLCKLTVAAKALQHAWTRHETTAWTAEIHRIDAAGHFGVSADACLLTIHNLGGGAETCPVHPSLSSPSPDTTIGLVDGCLVADLDAHDRTRDLHIPAHLWPSGATTPGTPQWRSGIKHDAARIMELTLRNGRYWNGFGDAVRIEPTHLFPLVKGGDLDSGRMTSAGRYLVVPQRHPGEDTRHLAVTAPRTWAYLSAHQALFERRSSRIYRGKPPFSVFGVGPYTFHPFKVAVSALHKSPVFRAIGPEGGKPVVFDDTCYLLPCDSETQARALAAFLNTDPVTTFLRARRFDGEKRQVTAQLLNRLTPRAAPKTGR